MWQSTNPKGNYKLTVNNKVWCSVKVKFFFLDKEHKSVFSPSQGPPPECYLKYFLHQSPPQGLLIDHPDAEVYVCQSVPESPDTYFFATLFDDKAGIAILSAYTVTYEQARNMGMFPRENVSNSWRTNKGKLSEYSLEDLLMFSYLSFLQPHSNILWTDLEYPPMMYFLNSSALNWS